MSGVVVDEGGRPLAGVEVRLHAVEVAALRGLDVADGALVGEAKSEHDGTFEIAAQAQGIARVRASAPGRGNRAKVVGPSGARVTLRLAAEAALNVRLLAEPAAGSGWIEIEGAGTRTRVALQGDVTRIPGLAAGMARVRVAAEDGRWGEAGPLRLVAGVERDVDVAIAPAARLGGRVTDAQSGAPIAEARVVVAGPGRAVAEATTDADGRFGPLPVGLPGSALQVSVSAGGYRDVLLPVRTLPTGASPVELALALEPAEPWTGRVEDTSGAAVPGARVAYTADGIAGRTPAATTTDAEGRFTLVPPPPPAPGRRIVLVAEGVGGRAALALRPDTPRPEPLVLRLEAEMSLRARVLDAAGAPIDGAWLRVFPEWQELRGGEAVPADRQHALNAQGGDLSGWSDADGEVLVAGLAPGPWRVVLEHAGQAREVGALVRVEGEDVDLGEIRIGSGGALEGEVLGPDGRAVDGARVRATPAAEPRARPALATANASGRFRITDLAPGRYVVLASSPWGTSVRTEVDAPASALRLDLPGARRVTLDARGPDGPFEGALVVTLHRPRQDTGAAWTQSVRTTQGRAVLEDVPPGAWDVVARAAALQGRSVEPLRVGDEGDVGVALTLAPPAGLEGTLTTPTGEPVAGGEVVLATTDGSTVRTLTDARGRWRIDALASSGDPRVTARGAGGAETTQSIALRDGTTTTLDLVLAPAGSLTLHVVDDKGRSVAGALIAVSPQTPGVPGARAQGRTDAQGRLTLRDLAVVPVLAVARLRDGREARQAFDVVAGRTLEIELRLGP